MLRTLRILSLCILSTGCTATGVEYGEASPEALAGAVLEAVESRDVARLRELALTEEEFRRVVWPDLPAAVPERNLTADYVWSDLHVRSEAGLARTVADRVGAGAELVSVRFKGATSQYRHYLVHRDAELLVRTAGGTYETLRLFGSVLEQNNRFRVFSYITD